MVDNQQLSLSINAVVTTFLEFTHESVNHTSRSVSVNGTLTYNNSGTITPLSYTMFNVSIDEGNNGTITTDSNGLFNYTIDALDYGSHTITVSFVGNESFAASSDSYIFDVNKTNIDFANLTSVVNDTTHFVMISGQIIDDDNNLSDVNVSLLYLDGTSINYTITNGSGGFSFNLGVLSPGSYTYVLNASENATHNGEITTINVIVPKFDSIINLNANNITYGNNTNISATLTNSSGGVLSGKNITFNINGANHTATTDGSGVTALNDVTGLGAGEYNVTATFSGDSNYNPSSNNTIFGVAKMNTNLNINKTVNSTNVIVGDYVSYNITPCYQNKKNYFTV